MPRSDFEVIRTMVSKTHPGLFPDEVFVRHTPTGARFIIVPFPAGPDPEFPGDFPAEVAAYPVDWSSSDDDPMVAFKTYIENGMRPFARIEGSSSVEECLTLLAAECDKAMAEYAS